MWPPMFRYKSVQVPDQLVRQSYWYYKHHNTGTEATGTVLHATGYEAAHQSEHTVIYTAICSIVPDAWCKYA